MNKMMLCAGVLCAGLAFVGCNDPGSAVKKYGAAKVERDYDTMNKYTENKDGAHVRNVVACIEDQKFDTIKIVGKPEIDGDKAKVKYTVEETVVVKVKDVNGTWKIEYAGL